MTEYAAIWDALVRFSYCDGRKVDPSEQNIVGNLLQLAVRYSASGHWVAAELERLLDQVTRMPKTAPEKPAWFVATIEHRLQRRTHASRSNEPATQSEPARSYLSILFAATRLPGVEKPLSEQELAQHFELEAGGNRFEAVQECLSRIKGTDSADAGILLQAALYMISEGWANVTPRKAPVVEFGQRDERKKA